MLNKINHIGIAVRSLNDAIPLYRDVFRMVFRGVEHVAGYQVNVAFFEIGKSKIELLEPSSEGSFLTEFLETRGEGFHHIAYEVDDIEAAIGDLLAKGTKMIDHTPRQGAHGARVAFIHQDSSQGVVTELCQIGDAGGKR